MKSLAQARKELGIVCEHILHGHRSAPCPIAKDLADALEALIDAKLGPPIFDCGPPSKDNIRDDDDALLSSG